MTREAVRGVGLNVEVAGQGDAVILLHGFTGTAMQWADQADMLSRSYRTVCVDLLGHGGSDAPADARRYGMDDCARDLVALLDRLGCASADWIGYSMGGRVALGLALAFPDRVRRLVLESASPGIEREEERQARRSRDEALAERIERVGVEAFVDEWMAQPLFSSQGRLPEPVRRAAREERCRNHALGLANSLRGIGSGAQPSYWRRLGELAMPVLLLAGEEDAKFSAIARAMGERIRGARVALVPDAGHNVHLENPDRFITTVLHFLSEPAVRKDSGSIPPQA